MGWLEPSVLPYQMVGHSFVTIDSVTPMPIVRRYPISFGDNLITSLRKNFRRALPVLWRNCDWIIRVAARIKPCRNTLPGHHALHLGDADRGNGGNLHPAGSVCIIRNERRHVLTADRA